MKTNSNRLPVEILESRIAPARIIDVGVPGNPGDTDYNEAPFVSLETAPGTDLIAAAVGKGLVGVEDTFYLRLKAGDTMKLFRFGGGAATEEFMLVTSGEIIAFFNDKNLDNEVQEQEITGISMGKNAAFELRAALPGDVVVNLNDKGTKDNADDELYMGAGNVSEKLIFKSIRLGSSIGGSVNEGVLFQTATETTPGGLGVSEVQDFMLTLGQNSVGQSFRLSYGNYTTSSLNSTATAAEVQDALNALKVIADVGGVVVTSGAPGAFTATFVVNGDQPELIQVRADSDILINTVETTAGGVGVFEVQTLNLGLLAGQTGQMTFNIDGPNGTESSGALPYDATSADIQTVLNAIPSIFTLGGVVVAGAVGGPFTITFNAEGDQNPFSVVAVTQSETVIGGNILAPANISNVTVAGAVQNILAGEAANGAAFDFFPKYMDATGRIVDVPGGDGVFTFAPAPGKAGPTISKIIVDRLGVSAGAVGTIRTGDGGEGGAGGSINQIEVRRDSDGFAIFAGDGGAAGALKKNGGRGGSLNNIFIDGVADASGNDPITLLAGDGGDSATGTGGLGGAVTNSYVGFRVLNGKPLFTQTLLRDNVFIGSGDGGDGKVGGKGGALTNLQVTVSAPDSIGDEIFIVAGDGGDALLTTSGRAGIGGAISRSVIQNVDLSQGHDMTLLAGDGGSAVLGKATGGVGGTISSMNIVGRQFFVAAGDGSSARIGAAGGSLATISFDQVNGVFPDTIVAFSGFGGDASAGNAGKGGNITAINVPVSDLLNFDVEAGNGGTSTGGKGGAGGLIKDLQVTDVDLSVAFGQANLFTLVSGFGGDGDKGGGAGGAMSLVSFTGVHIDIDVEAGSGGSALIKGAGGLGGALTNVLLSAERTVLRNVAGQFVQAAVDGIVVSGSGGDGAGTAGRGGAGGNMSTVNLNMQGSTEVFAGDGGSGSGAAPGKGGSINFAGMFALEGDGIMLGGSGGIDGTRPAAGGSITGKSLEQLTGAFAAFDLTVAAGDGTHGGAGGSLKFIGYGSTESALVPTPRGDIGIFAGDGSASLDGRYAGAGGSITDVQGSVSFTDGTFTQIIAGNGGSATKKGAAGGSITNLSLQRGGNAGVEFEVVAGDGGDTTAGATGGKGGSVTNVTVIDVAPEAIFRHVAAGDGGDGLKKGGTGGTVKGLDVFAHDIGLRAGEAYGYNALGGIFAGAAGAGAKPGLAGSVISVTADSIGSIVAGKLAAPQLADKIEKIYLNDDNLIERGFKNRDGFIPAYLPGIPGSQIVYIFNGERTNPLDKDVPAIDVENELNVLLSIAAAGGVVVTETLPNGYEVIFKNTGDRTQITGEEVFGYTATTLSEGQLNTPLQVVETVQGGDLLQIREVQTVVVNQNLLGRVTVNFGANATEFASVAAITAVSLQARLNLLPAIASAGGVTVVSPKANNYQVTFNEPGDRIPLNFQGDNLPLGTLAEITKGTPNPGGVREVQRFTPVAGGQVQLTYGENRTAYLTLAGTVAQQATTIQNALNALTSISAIGGVTVAQPAGVEGFNITFNTIGNNTPASPLFADRAPIFATSRVTVGATSTISGAAATMTVGDTNLNILEVQRIASPASGGFSLSFTFPLGGVATTNTTATLPAGIDAATLDAALDALPTIASAGGVTVTSPVAGFYDITFDSAGPMNQVTGNAIQVTQPVLEATRGQNSPNVQEVQTISYDPNGKFSATFPVALAAVETFKGSTAIGEKQVLDMAAVRAIAGATFTLSYGPATTAPLAATATAAEIQTALNGLATMPAGGVAVVDAAGKLTITFAQLADQPAVIVGAVTGGESTVQIDGTATPDTVRGSLQTALNNLPSITASGGVTVEIGAGNSMNVVFNTPGNKPSFIAANNVLETQTIDLLSAGEYTFTFGATSARIPAGAPLADIQAAFDVLTAGVGGATVSGGFNNGYTITFNTPGDQPEITAQQFLPIDGTTAVEGGAFQEKQLVTQPERLLLDPGYFNKPPGPFVPGVFTGANLVGGFRDATELSPQTFHWTDTDADGIYDLGEVPIDGIVLAKNYSQILSSFIPEARLAGAITGDINFTETVAGDAVTAEVQTLKITADSYTLAFGNNVTKKLTNKSSVTAIAKALNALPSIIAAGGVTVGAAGPSTYTVSFNSPGARTQVFAPFYYDYNNIIL